MADPLARPSWRGRTNVDAITIAAIEAAEKIAGKRFIVTQGSYQSGHGDINSAGTHDLGGAVDLRWTYDDSDILALRKVGFAAWHRTPDQGPWPHHIHAVLVDHPRLTGSAARQVVSYRAGSNGLKNNGRDDGPRLDPIPVFVWPQRKPERPSRVRTFLAETKIEIGRMRKARKVARRRGEPVEPYTSAIRRAIRARKAAKRTQKR